MFSIDDESFANVVRTARFFIQKKATSPGQPIPLEVLETAVRKAIDQLLEGSSPEEQELYASEACRHILDGLRVQIADEEILVDDSPQIDWYFGERRRARPHWDRYRRLLTGELRFDDTTAASVDRASDRIVEQLGDPFTDKAFDRRGLVVGQVQSGKTTSYAALINKAVDAGYQVIVVLTGIHESLRVQTQKRVEESVTGLATESGEAAGPPKGSALPLHHIHPLSNPPHLFTTRAVGGDFSSQANAFANYVTGTQMFVVKKNATILEELVKHFKGPAYRKQHNPASGRDEIVGRAVLVIDDEADNASVDLNRPAARGGGTRPVPRDKDHDPSTINKRIREILVRFKQRAYVGYTATPYANILIHKDNDTTEVGPDLFPEHFIVMLPAPSNYVGPAAFFGGTTTAEAESGGRPAPPLLRFVTDCGCTTESTDWMPRGHKKDHRPSLAGASGIPVTLQNAVISFVIAASLRQLRGWEKSHNSMLVHVSRFKKVQQLVQGQIGTFVYELKGALSDEAASLDLIRRFGDLYEDFRSTTAQMDASDRGQLFSVEQVKSKAREFLDRLKIWTVNSEAETALNYDQYPNGLNVVCVGGDKLSRGLTLEGLTVSYFLRASRMYDTLMQMGRWFGYRPGYKDLCRLFLTRELASWYQHVARADEELRGEFLALQDERRRPSDFGLRVRSHPTLLVTAPGKMASADEFTLNFGGRVSQTIQFFREPGNLKHNARVTREFLDRIAHRAETAPLARRDPETGDLSGKQPLGGRLYTRVDTAEIRAFLAGFRFHPEARSVSAPQLLQFLDGLVASGVGASWSVVVAGGAAGKRDPVSVAGDLSVVPVERATKPAASAEWNEEGGTDTITIGALASPTDLIADLTDHEVARLRSLPKGRLKVDPTEGEHAARSRACKARDADHCLLVLYVVQPTTDQGDSSGKKDLHFGGPHLPIGFALALPANDKMPSVRYVVNSVLIDELEGQYEVADRQEEVP
jgi:hypothetical protein